MFVQNNKTPTPEVQNDKTHNPEVHSCFQSIATTYELDSFTIRHIPPPTLPPRDDTTVRQATPHYTQVVLSEIFQCKTCKQRFTSQVIRDDQGLPAISMMTTNIPPNPYQPQTNDQTTQTCDLDFQPLPSFHHFKYTMSTVTTDLATTPDNEQQRNTNTTPNQLNIKILETYTQALNHSDTQNQLSPHVPHTGPPTYQLSPPHTFPPNNQEQTQNHMEPDTEPTAMDYLCTAVSQHRDQINNPPDTQNKRHTTDKVTYSYIPARTANMPNNNISGYNTDTTFHSTKYDSDLLTEPPTPHQQHSTSPQQQLSSTTPSPTYNYNYDSQSPKQQSSASNSP